MIPLSSALRIYDCTRNKLSKWRAAEHLTNEIPPGSAGVRTMITREAALEIGLMSTATAVGYEPADAKVIVENLLNQICRGSARSFWSYSQKGLFLDSSAGNKSLAHVMGSQDQADMPGGAAFRPPLAMRTINVGEIVARLDAALAEDAGE
jgi:hypothetical protein